MLFTCRSKASFYLVRQARNLCSGIALNNVKAKSRTVKSNLLKTLPIPKSSKTLQAPKTSKASKAPKTTKATKTTKTTVKKVKKEGVRIKRVAEDLEAVWLESLTPQNINLYRRTSYGSYKKINLSSFFERMVQIYPLTLKSVNVETIKETAPLVLESPSERTPPVLSDYLIKNITQFPLLKSECDNELLGFIKKEEENFGNIDVVSFPSVTTVLQDTMSEAAKNNLKLWKERLIAELGFQGFLKYQRDLLNQGSKFHSTIKTYLEVADKSLVTVDPQVEGCWKSLEKLLPNLGKAIFVEESVFHPVLMYKGIVDCVAHYRGSPCVIEWKKSEKQKPSINDTYDAPLQVCAYLGTLTWHRKVTVKNGLIVVAYTDGSPAHVFEMSLENCETYWISWLRRLQSYWIKKSPTIMQQEN